MLDHVRYSSGKNNFLKFDILKLKRLKSLKRYFINKDTDLIVMNHLITVVNSSDFNVFMSNELYQNHFLIWLIFKMDCLNESTVLVNHECMYKGFLILTIFVILSINLICKLLCCFWRQYQVLKSLLVMVETKNQVVTASVTPSRKRKAKQ
jgi:hypothetical protein